MKKIALCFIVLLITSCDVHRSARNVQTFYPDSEIRGMPGNQFQYLVRNPDNSIELVTNDGSSVVQSKDQLDAVIIFPAKK